MYSIILNIFHHPLIMENKIDIGIKETLAIIPSTNL